MITRQHTPAADDASEARSTASSGAGSLIVSPAFTLLGALILGVSGSYLIRDAYENIPDEFLSYSNTNLGITAAILIGFFLLRKVTSLPGTSALMNTIPAFTLSYLVVAAVFFAVRLDFSRGQFALSFALVVAFVFISAFAAARLRRPVYGYIPGGRADTLPELNYVAWIRLASISDAQKHADLPIVADLNSKTLDDEWRRFIAQSAISGRRVFNARHLKESLEGKVSVEHISENAFGHLAPDSIYAPLKHYIDVVAAIAALVLLAPLFLAVALIIRLESTGPALFRQQRIGYRGKPFMIYKFRSMHSAPEAAPSPGTDITLTGDPRITRSGKFIRRARIDELPQIINILLGQMSWIGPRPETLALGELYSSELGFYAYRHVVRPGITGWAQVKQGHVTSISDVCDKLQYDFFYVKNFSLWLDLLISIQTVRVILTGHGSR